MSRISAILTAAGESKRMGCPKPLLPWVDATLIEYQISILIEAGATQIIVVLGHEAEIVAPHVRGTSVQHILNPDYHHGKATSVKAGLRMVDAGSESIILLAVDQPRTATLIATIIDTHLRSNALITSPRYKGRGGHPVIFSAQLRCELEQITEEGEGVRAVFKTHRDAVNTMETDDPMVRLDLNTPEAYKHAKAFYGA